MKAPIEKIRRIQIIAKHLAEDLMAGAYLSAFKGRGLEVEDVREYQEGDDPRTIDWNVTARFSTPYVKSFREERNLTVFLAVDISSSTRFGSQNELVSDLIAEVGAVLAFSAISNNDRVGLVLFNSKIDKYVPAKKGTKHVLRLIQELSTAPSSSSYTNIKAALDTISKLQKQRCLIFLISDFLAEGFEKSLKIAARHHELIALRIIDPRLKHLPNIGLGRLKDLESGDELTVDTAKKSCNHALEKIEAERKEFLKGLFGKSNVGFLQIEMGQDYHRALKRFFEIRKKRR